MMSFSPSQIVRLALVVGLGRSQGVSIVDRVGGGGAEKSARVLSGAQRSSGHVSAKELDTDSEDVAQFWDHFLGNMEALTTSMGMPTQFPTIIPVPTPAPTPATTPPSLQPTPCLLNITLECIGCDVNSNFTECLQRPFMMGFFLRGGNCSENNFSQPLEQVNCTDYPENGDVPKQGSGETVYIRVNRDPRDKGDGDDFPSLFDDYVVQGDNYYVYTGNSSIPLPPDTQIRIYKDSNRDKDNLLQDVRFHASCSSPLLLDNIFGASQLIQFENDLQGNVSTATSTLTTFNLSIPITSPIGSETLNITIATIRTNYTDPTVTELPIVGQLICTEAIANDPNEPCNQTEIEVEFETTLNLNIPQGYYQEVTVVARGLETGEFCLGIDDIEFFAPADQQPTS